MARPASVEDQENAALDLLMRASTRYRSISLSANHAQRLGLERFLTTAQQQRWPTFLFYTWESPEVRESLLDEATYAARSAELHTVLQPYLSDRLRYSPGISDLPAERYLDHIHVDAAGYERLFEQFASDLAKLWGP